MVINPEKLLRPSFPAFGQVVVLVIDATAKDSDSVGLASLRHSVAEHSPPHFGAPGAAALWAQPRRGKRACCQHRGTGQRGGPGAASPQRQLRPGPAVSDGSQGEHGALSTPGTTAAGDTRDQEHNFSQSSRDAADMAEQALAEAVDSAPTRYPARTWVPR